MALDDLVDVTKGALQDDAIGLAMMMRELARLKRYTDIETDLTFTEWFLSDRMKPTGKPNVFVVGTGWTPTTVNPVQRSVRREARGQIRLGYEIVRSDPARLQRNVAVAMTAMMQVIDVLRDYSDRVHGTIVGVINPVSFTPGDFPSQGGRMPTTYGFTGTLTVLEYSPT